MPKYRIVKVTLYNEEPTFEVERFYGIGNFGWWHSVGYFLYYESAKEFIDDLTNPPIREVVE